MKVRLTKVDEYQLLTCLEHGLWGSNKARFKDWKQGDNIIFIVGKVLTAFAEVAGSSFIAKEAIWANGLYPYRVPIRFHCFLEKNNRIPILGNVRQALMDSWGSIYGWGIRDQRPLSEEAGTVLLEELNNKPNALQKIKSELTQKIAEAKLERNLVSQKKQKPRIFKKSAFKEEVTSEDATLHTRLQRQLIELGSATGCLVWIASADRSKASSDSTTATYLTSRVSC